MKITPSDLQHQSFNVKFRGYDREEVRAFLNFVSEEYEMLVSEGTRSREETVRLREKLSDLEERERILKDTLLSAQRMADDLKETAKKEAALIVKEAELRADAVIEQAQHRLRKLQEEAAEVRLLRTTLEEKLQLYINNLQKMLDMHQEEDSSQDRLSLFSRLQRREKS
ncbi:MAG: DivIVA domain-containing protein [Acidobacteria bacterium]|nr:DivIVA domain-containing protein [Acidobacteriota bacterium]